MKILLPSINLLLIAAGSPGRFLTYALEEGLSITVVNEISVEDNGLNSAHAPVWHKVIVGNDGKSQFKPPYVSAGIGDIIRFYFTSGNHTVTRSSLEHPCLATGDLDTEFQANEDGSHFDYEVYTTAPLWFHCRQGESQTMTQNHCESGMVFAINPGRSWNDFLMNSERPSVGSRPDTTSTNTFATFPSAAITSGCDPWSGFYGTEGHVPTGTGGVGIMRTGTNVVISMMGTGNIGTGFRYSPSSTRRVDPPPQNTGTVPYVTKTYTSIWSVTYPSTNPASVIRRDDNSATTTTCRNGPKPTALSSQRDFSTYSSAATNNVISLAFVMFLMGIHYAVHG